MRKNSHHSFGTVADWRAGLPEFFLSTISFRNKIADVVQSRTFIALVWCCRVIAVQRTYDKSAGGSID